MITLYQLHWSHYVEKVRWALDYKGVEWSSVEVDPLTKRQMRHLECKTTLESGRQLRTVPVIHDEATGATLNGSSEIIQYLEQVYPAPALYPADTTERDEVTRWMLWLDSTLGLTARRLAYAQIALEHPGLLAELFIPGMAGASGIRGLKARVVGAVIAGVVAGRFRILHNRADRVFEQTEHCLLMAAGRLSSHRHLVGERFSAADLTLAALLRPLVLVPFFRKHSRLQRLFDWRDALLQEHRRERQSVYEVAMHEARRRRGWALGAVSWLPPSDQHRQNVRAEIPALEAARNDQQPIGRYPVIKGALRYLRLRQTCGLGRTSYA